MINIENLALAISIDKNDLSFELEDSVLTCFKEIWIIGLFIQYFEKTQSKEDIISLNK